LKRFVLLLALLFAACDQLPQVPPLVFSVWRDSGIVGYVMGTIHYGVKLDHIGNLRVAELISGSSSLHVERLHDDPRFFQDYEDLLATRMTGKTWSDLVPASDLAAITSLGAKAGVDPFAYTPSKAHPIFLVGAAMRRCDGKKAYGSYSMDAELQISARQSGKAVTSIESAASAAAPVLALPDTVWRDYLLKADAFTSGQLCSEPVASYVTKTIQAYRKGDIEEVRAASLEMQKTSEIDAVHTPMIFGRDSTLSSAVLASFRSANPKSTVFVTVGAAHLAGAEGVVQSLTRAGYIVKRLEPIQQGAN
jgi:uncharacterized protein YbaP (TraB family)